MCKRITPFAIITIALLICIPSFAQHFLGAFAGLALHLDTQVETPAQNNNAQTLPEQQTGDTIRFQLFAPAGGGQATNGYTVELDLPGKTFSSYIRTASGQDWTGAALTSTGSATLSALLLTGGTVPSTGYLGQIDLQVTQPLEDGATLIVKSLVMTSGNDVDPLDVSNAVITFTATSAPSGCPGDFDGNGSVNIADFLAFVNVFGSGSADATYNAQMDLDSSGSVDIADFLAFVNVFGSECGGGNGNNGGSGGGGGSSGAITRMAFDTPRLLAGGYAQTTLELNISGVTGGPALFKGGYPGGNSAHQWASGMLLAKVKGCNFVANEVDRKSKVYIKVRPAVEVEEEVVRSETVCGVSSNTHTGYRPWTTGITHLLFFDETSPTNMREAVYNDATDQYDIRVVDSLPAFINGTIYLAKSGWIQDRNNWIQRLNLDGFNLEMLINNHPRAMSPANVSLDVNGGKMYWMTNRGIHRANLNGSNIEELVPQEEHGRSGFTLDVNRGKMYWSENNRIYRANLDGSNVELFSLDNAYYIAVGRDKIYYISGGLKRINLDGSGPEDIAQPGFYESFGSVAVDTTNSKIYIGVRYLSSSQRYTVIVQANLDGSEWKEFGTKSGGWSINDIAVDGKQGKIYYLVTPKFGDNYQILCAEPNGDNIQVLYNTQSYSIALDASSR